MPKGAFNVSPKYYSHEFGENRHVGSCGWDDIWINHLPNNHDGQRHRDRSGRLLLLIPPGFGTFQTPAKTLELIEKHKITILKPGTHHVCHGICPAGFDKYDFFISADISDQRVSRSYGNPAQDEGNHVR